MARPIHLLSDRKVRNADEGLHSDGGNLLLRVTAGAAGQLNKSWLFRFAIAGRERRIGLGSYPTVSLADAREKAADARKLVAQRIAPIGARGARLSSEAVATARAMTFDQCRDAYIASHRAGWRSVKHGQQWKRSLDMYVTPMFGKLPVSAIDTALIMKVLDPMWRTVPDAAMRVRGRIKSILDWARVRGFRSGENPARWRGHLDHLLPARFKVRAVNHHTALPYIDVASFMRELRTHEVTSARALEFLILTAARTNEVLGMRWSEIDDKTWTVPADRMKGGKEHRVPLSNTALRIIAHQAKMRENDFVFPGHRRYSLSPMTLVALLRRTGHSFTVHGFRSTFRDWAAEKTPYPREVAEAALAHAVGSKVEQAYQRGDLFEKRTQLMDDWSDHCTKPPDDASDKVVPMCASA